MAFVVVADPPEQFAAWLANEARAAADPADPVLQQGKQVFLGSACVYCHAIQALDDDIGHVDDFIVDDATWAIRYIVVDTRGWWPGKRALVAPGTNSRANRRWRASRTATSSATR